MMSMNAQASLYEQYQKEIYNLNKNFDPFQNLMTNESLGMLELATQIANISSGAGWGEKYSKFVSSAGGKAQSVLFNQSHVNTLAGMEKFNLNCAPPNILHSGYVFMSKPRLMLTSANLKQDRVMALLDTLDPLRYETSMRGYLDSHLPTIPEFQQEFSKCPYFNSTSPFIIPAQNALRQIAGYPDFSLNTYTTQGGDFEEDQTQASGSDFCSRTYNFNLDFMDIQGTYLFQFFYYWVRYIALIKMGIMNPYNDDMAQRLLNYTTRIYRFIMSPNKRQIQICSAVTGCFPTNVPFGSMFDFNKDEHRIHAAHRFSVPFVGNAVDYQDWAILVEFNILVNRYTQLEKKIKSGEVIEVPRLPQYNYIGTPYIALNEGYAELRFYAPKEQIDACDPQVLLQQLRNYSQKVQQSILQTNQEAVNNILQTAENSNSFSDPISPITTGDVYASEASGFQNSSESSLLDQAFSGNLTGPYAGGTIPSSMSFT